MTRNWAGAGMDEGVESFHCWGSRIGSRLNFGSK
jgi:hypothetical protein